jgi:hypothetical protein
MRWRIEAERVRAVLASAASTPVIVAAAIAEAMWAAA